MKIVEIIYQEKKCTIKTAAMNRRLALLASVKTAGDNATMEQKTILDTTNFSKEPGKNMVHLTILCKSLAMKTKRIIE